MINLQLPPNDAIPIDKPFAESKLPLELFADVAGENLVLVQAFDNFVVERGQSPSSSSSTSLTYSFRDLPRSSKQIKPFPSQSGRRFLMNSRSDGRINSAIIPSSGDFGLLQISQTSVAGAVLLIDLALRLKMLSPGCRFLLLTAVAPQPRSLTLRGRAPRGQRKRRPISR